jgi:hypothetical protein
VCNLQGNTAFYALDTLLQFPRYKRVPEADWEPVCEQLNLALEHSNLGMSVLGAWGLEYLYRPAYEKRPPITGIHKFRQVVRSESCLAPRASICLPIKLAAGVHSSEYRAVGPRCADWSGAGVAVQWCCACKSGLTSAPCVARGWTEEPQKFEPRSGRAPGRAPGRALLRHLLTRIIA